MGCVFLPLVMYYSAAVNPCGDAALQIPPPLLSMQSALLPAASAKTGAARRDANGWGQAGTPDGLMLAVGDRGCL